MTIVAHDVAHTGGMERQLMRLATGLLERGFDLVVIAKRCDLAPHPRLKVVRVRTPSRPRTIAYPAFFALGSLMVGRHSCGILHTTGALIGSRADLSTVHFCHHAYAHRAPTSRQRRRGALYSLNATIVAGMVAAGERYCFRPSRTRQLVSVSRGASVELNQYFAGYERNVSIIPNGVDRLTFQPDAEARASVRRILGISPEVCLAVFVGGEWERKGLNHAIDALPDADGWHLLVVGSGAEVAARRRANGLGVGSRLHMTGRVTDPERYLASGDAFVLPTGYETFSMATFEAAACGLPLLNTRVSGADEIVRDGRTGYIIDADAASVVRGLRQLADPADRRRMGANARAATAAYDWESVVDMYVELYARLA
ncbi:MAG TPA: glycosyltransferase family 4 protein [Solirubrobacteraceae bacterium]|nr:glycosyltransferase family 4 protein [Solirubrobacteraceae bacterium]